MIISVTDSIYIHIGKEPKLEEKDFEVEGKTVYYDDECLSANVEDILNSLNNETVIFCIAIMNYFIGIYKD
ncbi:hypothetical protein MBBAR_10c00620 [Methanobrevibacter arboriphilus JCM 13429 = DSM 1125]|uniref:Uncharacterized protein n=1 Tax=Methanobrevibacter arboriphilus JCM 13429 = DSM 1125 TaxID=1300164 RepID=A0A1V6N217_METAZ|nr:hypothetical protein [Methanobrevibacter arboriphilus]OQD58721.1 hypothetical protein MBBAR_10c00620 [Methanobrevibacter arboriphilus JCM 13429 = DSM 1125]